jgi:hypothetical protein
VYYPLDLPEDLAIIGQHSTAGQHRAPTESEADLHSRTAKFIVRFGTSQPWNCSPVELSRVRGSRANIGSAAQLESQSPGLEAAWCPAPHRGVQ